MVDSSKCYWKHYKDKGGVTYSDSSSKVTVIKVTNCSLNASSQQAIICDQQNLKVQNNSILL